MAGADISSLVESDPGATQVVDLRELDLRDIDVSKLDAPRSLPPPLPASVTASASPGPNGTAASGRPVRGTAFYLAIVAATLLLSLVVGFVVASAMKPAPAPAAPERVITIDPVEVK